MMNLFLFLAVPTLFVLALWNLFVAMDILWHTLPDDALSFLCIIFGLMLYSFGSINVGVMIVNKPWTAIPILAVYWIGNVYGRYLIRYVQAQKRY